MVGGGKLSGLGRVTDDGEVAATEQHASPETLGWGRGRAWNASSSKENLRAGGAGLVTTTAGWQHRGRWWVETVAGGGGGSGVQ